MAHVVGVVDDVGIELVPMAVLLASPAGAAITGQVISVDGGFKV